MTVRAGRLRHRLQVFETTTEKDEFGALIKGKLLVGTYWCEANHTSNTTVGGADIYQNQNSVQFTTRYNKRLGNLDNNMYIVFSGQEYDIESVINPRLLNEYMVITAILRG